MYALTPNGNVRVRRKKMQYPAHNATDLAYHNTAEFRISTAADLRLYTASDILSSNAAEYRLRTDFCFPIVFLNVLSTGLQKKRFSVIQWVKHIEFKVKSLTKF